MFFLPVGIPADYMCTTGPGLLGCREVIHASFCRDHQVIRTNCKKILKLCESKGYHSAAFPAVNIGSYRVSMDVRVCVFMSVCVYLCIMVNTKFVLIS